MTKESMTTDVSQEESMTREIARKVKGAVPLAGGYDPVTVIVASAVHLAADITERVLTVAEKNPTFAGINEAGRGGLAKKAQAAFSRSGPDTISSLRKHPSTPKVDGPKVEL